MAPPPLETLFVKVEPTTVRSALLVMAPPEVDVFESNTTFVTVRGALLWMALPTARVRVIPLMDKLPKLVPTELLVKMRTALLPSIVNRFAPGPIIVRLSPVGVFMLKPVAKVIV